MVVTPFDDRYAGPHRMWWWVVGLGGEGEGGLRPSHPGVR